MSGEIATYGYHSVNLVAVYGYGITRLFVGDLTLEVTKTIRLIALVDYK